MSFKLRVIEGGRAASKDMSRLNEQREALAQAAQRVLDNWQQDENGFDEEYGAGGVCQDIAGAMSVVLNEAGFEDVATIFSEFDGGHVFVMVLGQDGEAYNVDIPASVYETGFGYTWTKKEGVQLNADHVVVESAGRQLSRDDFHEEYNETGPAPGL